MLAGKDADWTTSVQTSYFKFRSAYELLCPAHLFSAVCGPNWLKFGGLLTTSEVISPKKFQTNQSADGQEKVCPTQLLKAKYGNLNLKDEV